MACALCEDLASTGDVVFEDDATAVVLHSDWSVRGHAMIVHRRHVENASDLTDAEWTHFSDVWRRAERVLLEATGCERAVILKLGIATPHLHVHIYPVPASATREQVFAAIDGRVAVGREEGFARRVRDALR
jgi:diadenosine tetraphosphate (Ap4A) HIT family hydrolase